MKQRLLIALLTVFVFAAGFVARMMTESDVSVPPPPALGSEFMRSTNGDATHFTEKKPAAKPAFDRAKLVAEIEALRPQIEAYRARLDAIDADYEKAFVRVLDSGQRRIYDQKLADYQKRRAERDAKAAAAPPPPPLTDEEIAKLRQRPFEVAFWKVSYTGRLEQMVKDYKLDATQREQVAKLLRGRRDSFLALVDSTPPPTFKLTALVTSVQRLAEPGQPSVAPTPSK